MEFHDIDMDAMTEHIKVNLSSTEEEYQSGNGEGMWILVTPKTKKAHDNDVKGGIYFGILDNPSLYYSVLECGDLIPFEMRGTNRPVADFYGFLAGLTDQMTPKEKLVLAWEIAEMEGMVEG